MPASAAEWIGGPRSAGIRFSVEAVISAGVSWTQNHMSSLSMTIGKSAS
jgi:hypothetical protein